MIVNFYCYSLILVHIHNFHGCCAHEVFLSFCMSSCLTVKNMHAINEAQVYITEYIHFQNCVHRKFLTERFSQTEVNLAQERIVDNAADLKTMKEQVKEWNRNVASLR